MSSFRKMPNWMHTNHCVLVEAKLAMHPHSSTLARTVMSRTRSNPRTSTRENKLTRLSNAHLHLGHDRDGQYRLHRSEPHLTPPRVCPMLTKFPTQTSTVVQAPSTTTATHYETVNSVYSQTTTITDVSYTAVILEQIYRKSKC
jgi:hypothetical protein